MDTETRTDIGAQTIEELTPSCLFARHPETPCSAKAEWYATFLVECGAKTNGLYCTTHKDRLVFRQRSARCPNHRGSIESYSVTRLERL